MTKRRLVCTLSGIFMLSAAGLMLSRADDSDLGDQLPVAHGECTAFSVKGREAMAQAALGSKVSRHSLTRTTDSVMHAMAAGTPAISRLKSFDQSTQLGTIDSYLLADMQAAGVQPAPMTTDWEFIRRVTLDLTGRIPTPAATLSFVADTSAKRNAPN